MHPVIVDHNRMNNSYLKKHGCQHFACKGYRLHSIPTRWGLEWQGDTPSSPIFPGAEMGSLFQVYGNRGLNLLRKFMDNGGCRISFNRSRESQQ